MAIKKMASKVKVEVMNRVRAAPFSAKDMFAFLDFLPPTPATTESLGQGPFMPLAPAPVPTLLVPAPVTQVASVMPAAPVAPVIAPPLPSPSPHASAPTASLATLPPPPVPVPTPFFPAPVAPVLATPMPSPSPHLLHRLRRPPVCAAAAAAWGEGDGKGVAITGAGTKKVGTGAGAGSVATGMKEPCPMLSVVAGVGGREPRNASMSLVDKGAARTPFITPTLTLVTTFYIAMVFWLLVRRRY